ncbi:S41 family peptidase [Flexithrix dorotheae]|uniref:S41 family peptidase n=1 Tax=Flexithrix dorotheae TaxID=70993 RepID=UPI00036D694D|nr:S41 family peptidase [Flexithrix dorotheae]
MIFRALKYLLSISVFLSIAFAFTPIDRHFEIAKNLEIFASLYREVNDYYVEEISPTDLANAAIHSMLASLDPYTNYIPEDQIEDYRTMTTGEYGGIGAEIKRKNGKVIISMPLEGYAADKAGLQIGDEIIAINGLDISERPLSNIENMLRGQADTKVKLTIKRFNLDNELHFELLHEKVRQKNVPYFGMINEDIGFIKLTDFTQKAGLEVQKALENLMDQGAKKVILDLRGNPGGLLNEAVNITNVFLPKGLDIVSMRGKTDDWSKNYKSLNEPTSTDIPMAVLIDNNSASASEIVSGVIQDYDRGVIVGQRSFGKGLVQTTTGISYNSQLKVTVAKYFIPSGRCIQEIDYSQRNALGLSDHKKGVRRNEFKTKAGREVYDGAGIDPDVLTPTEIDAPITKSLKKRDLIFQYASIFRNNHDTIPGPKDFKLSDAQYDEFIEWLSDKEYGYNTRVENSLERLTESAKKEKYFDDIKSQISSLEEKISTNKADDLQKFKKEIKAALEHEIAIRFYLQTGEIESSFYTNPDIISAMDILNDQEKYAAILRGSE